MDVAIFKGRLDRDSPQLKLGGHDVRKRQEWDGGRAPLIIFALVEIDGHSFAGTAERDAAKAGLVTKSLEVEKLKVQIARLKRVTFGSSSERIAREIEQLELKLEELETEEAAAPAAEETFAPNEPLASPDKPAKPRRTICRVAPISTSLHLSAVIVVASCARSARTSPRS